MPRRVHSKSARIASKLRAEIIAGRLGPGASLPTWDRMEAQFGAGRPTLTRAMAELKEDGFIRATRSKGTFVHDRPPHLTRFGMVFPSHPSIAYRGLGRWNRFWQMLSTLAPMVGQELDLEVPVYFNLGVGLGEDEDRLAQDLAHQRLGGLIVVSADTTRHPLLHDSAMPQVVVHAHPEEVNVPCIYVDRNDFVERALATMREQGRRRIAVLTDRYFGFHFGREPLMRTGNEAIAWGEVHQDFAALMAGQGFHSEPHWQLMVTPAAARNVVRLLFNQPEAERPDGLIICDDNLKEEALAGVIGAGVLVPEQLTVVSHCNWPALPHPLVPTIGVGYDVPDFLRLCIRTLRDIQKGVDVPPLQLMAACLEGDLRPDAGSAQDAFSYSRMDSSHP